MREVKFLVLLLALLALPSHGQREAYVVYNGKSALGKYDYSCKKLDDYGKLANYCVETGGLAAVAEKCTKDPQCASFDMEGWQKGYLKSGGGSGNIENQIGFTHFCKRSKGCGSGGQYVMWMDKDVAPGHDIDCNYRIEGVRQKYCQAPGNQITLMYTCNDTPGCHGFVISPQSNGKYGVLKGNVNPSSSLTDNLGYTYFAKAEANPTFSSKKGKLK